MTTEAATVATQVSPWRVVGVVCRLSRQEVGRCEADQQRLPEKPCRGKDSQHVVARSQVHEKIITCSALPTAMARLIAPFSQPSFR
jgi:hypothetical protein